MNLYPVNLDINNKRCLIIGGGEVAGRKVKSLISCGARVEVISPEATDEILELGRSGLIVHHQRKYQHGDLQGAFLVFAATDNRLVQQKIIEEANQLNVLVNAADNPVACSFQVPARVRRGNFLITVSTGGGSPALAARIREELEKEYGREYEQFVDLLSKIRQHIVTDGQNSGSHRELFQKLLQLNLLSQIRQQDWSSLQDELRAILPEDIAIDELISSIHSTRENLASEIDSIAENKENIHSGNRK